MNLYIFSFQSTSSPPPSLTNPLDIKYSWKLSKSCQKVWRATKFSKSHNIQLQDPAPLAKAIKMFPSCQIRYANLVWKEVFLKVKVHEANYAILGGGWFSVYKRVSNSIYSQKSIKVKACTYLICNGQNIDYNIQAGTTCGASSQQIQPRIISS